MKRRIATIATCTAAVLAFATGQHASAEPIGNTTEGTWACAAVREVAGMCLENPGEPITKRGGVVGIVGDILDPGN